MDRRQHDRLVRPGRRASDRRTPAAGYRRVVLVGPNEVWRLLTACLFEDAGYAVYVATDQLQATALTTRRLPDVVVVETETPETLDLLARLSLESNTRDIPVVVLAWSLQSREARRARDAGAVILLAHYGEGEVLVGEVDTLIAAAPRAQRALKRRLVDLKELARYYKRAVEGQARLRRLIDGLQGAILAVDEQGRCIAASQGATMLTGYSRLELLTPSVFQAEFNAAHVSDELWRPFPANREPWTAAISNRTGQEVTVHVVAEEVMPGLHVVAFAPA